MDTLSGFQKRMVNTDVKGRIEEMRKIGRDDTGGAWRYPIAVKEHRAIQFKYPKTINSRYVELMGEENLKVSA